MGIEKLAALKDCAKTPEEKMLEQHLVKFAGTQAKVMRDDRKERRRRRDEEKARYMRAKNMALKVFTIFEYEA